NCHCPGLRCRRDGRLVVRRHRDTGLRKPLRKSKFIPVDQMTGRECGMRIPEDRAPDFRRYLSGLLVWILIFGHMTTPKVANTEPNSLASCQWSVRGMSGEGIVGGLTRRKIKTPGMPSGSRELL